jgi:hypothetical protein
MAQPRTSSSDIPITDFVSRTDARTGWWRKDDGAATAEYAIAILAAAGFAGLLVTILTSDTARGWLQSIIERALSL